MLPHHVEFNDERFRVDIVDVEQELLRFLRVGAERLRKDHDYERQRMIPASAYTAYQDS